MIHLLNQNNKMFVMKILFQTFVARIPALVAASALLLLGACSPYPSEDDYITDFDIVYTYYDETVSFSGYTTFAVPDKIPYLTNTPAPVYLDDTNASMATMVKNRIISNMTARGYTQVDATDGNPDLLVSIGVLNEQVITGTPGCWWYDDPYYWDWYPDWGWDIGWGWDYYPCWGDYYSYNQGSLVVDLTDTAASVVVNCDQNNSNCTLDVVWNFTINGLLADTSSSLDARIQKGIDQAFTQSPYLKK